MPYASLMKDNECARSCSDSHPEIYRAQGPCTLPFAPVSVLPRQAVCPVVSGLSPTLQGLDPQTFSLESRHLLSLSSKCNLYAHKCKSFILNGSLRVSWPWIPLRLRPLPLLSPRSSRSRAGSPALCSPLRPSRSAGALRGRPPGGLISPARASAAPDSHVNVVPVPQV